MPWLTQPMWNTCLDMEDVLACFKGICSDITTTPIKCKLGRLDIQVNPEEWEGYVEKVEEKDKEGEEQKKEEEEKKVELKGKEGDECVAEGSEIKVGQGSWDERLTMFQKLCVVKSFKEEKVLTLTTHHALRPPNLHSNFFIDVYGRHSCYFHEIAFLCDSLPYLFCVPYKSISTTSFLCIDL